MSTEMQDLTHASGYLHMTNTFRLPGEPRWQVACRCGWHADGYVDMADARAAGDDHLAVANAPEGTTS